MMSLKAKIKRFVPSPLIGAYRSVRYNSNFSGLDYQGVFQKIHDKNMWGDTESISGSGSTISVTEVFRGELARWLAENDVRSLVDVPCGDFNWMRLVQFPPTFQYLGLDIVPDLIDRNRATYGSPHRRFERADILSSDLAIADAYLCKDLFIHFPNSAITEAVDRLRTRTHYILATTFPNTVENEDIRFGEARRVNMTAFLGEPAELLKDFGGGVTDRFIGVWRMAGR